MNEKLKELAEQAGFEITPWGNESVPCVHQAGPIDVELEKFAELIVRECADYANWYQANSRYTDIAKAIKEHFGVEE
jgi:hypothetical protein